MKELSREHGLKVDSYHGKATENNFNLIITTEFIAKFPLCRKIMPESFLSSKNHSQRPRSHTASENKTFYH